MGFRTNYWSTSRFADWVRGAPKPTALSLEDWKSWRNDIEGKHPIRYWIAEEGLDHLQDFINFPRDTWAKIHGYIENRWFDKTHALTSNLSRGDWHELDERILHSIFDELVNFVEVDLAWMHVVFSDDAWEKFSAYRSFPFRFKRWRNRDAGLAYLDWASKLSVDESLGIDPHSPEYGTMTDQATTSVEIKDLYIWWTEKRPNRPDASEVSGWDDYFAAKDKSSYTQDYVRDILMLDRDIESKYDEEDNEMLFRLIKIRKSLWT